MAIRITLQTKGLDKVNRRLRGWETNTRDMRPVWRRIILSFERAEARLFDSEGGYLYGGWAPLSPDYADWKAEYHPESPMLVLHGDLRASLTDSGAPGAVRTMTPKHLRMGSSIEYADYHQEGTDFMPARPIVGTSPQLRGAWTRMMRDYILGQDSTSLVP